MFSTPILYDIGDRMLGMEIINRIYTYINTMHGVLCKKTQAPTHTLSHTQSHIPSQTHAHTTSAHTHSTPAHTHTYLHKLTHTPHPHTHAPSLVRILVHSTLYTYVLIRKMYGVLMS